MAKRTKKQKNQVTQSQYETGVEYQCRACGQPFQQLQFIRDELRGICYGCIRSIMQNDEYERYELPAQESKEIKEPVTVNQESK